MDGLILGKTGGTQAPAMGFGAGQRSGPGGLLREEEPESHTLVIGGTGSGKSRNFVTPQLLSYRGGCVAIDVKAELFFTTARYRRTLGPVLVLDPFHQVSNGQGAFNVLSMLDNDSTCFIDDVYALASLFDNGLPANGKDGAFWSESGLDVIAGIIAHVVSNEKETDRSLGRVYERLSAHDLVYSLAVMLDNEKPSEFTLSTIGKFLALPDLTRGGVLATFSQQIRLLASSSVRRSLASNSLDLSRLIDGLPFTIYLVWPPDKLQSHAALIRILLTGITNLLLKRKHRPEHRTLFLLDEVGQIGRVPALLAASTLGRGYGIKVSWMFQTIAQLRHSYGAEAQIIIDNCATSIALGRMPNWAAAETLSDTLFGDVSADRIFKLTNQELVLRQAGAPSIIGHKVDYLTDSLFAGKFDCNPLHEPMQRASGIGMS